MGEAAAGTRRLRLGVDVGGLEQPVLERGAPPPATFEQPEADGGGHQQAFNLAVEEINEATNGGVDVAFVDCE